MLYQSLKRRSFWSEGYVDFANQISDGYLHGVTEECISPEDGLSFNFKNINKKNLDVIITFQKTSQKTVSILNLPQINHILQRYFPHTTQKMLISNHCGKKKLCSKPEKYLKYFSILV